MAADDLTVAGRRFRTRADYEAALRDQRKIDAIRSQTDLSDPVQLYKLFGVLQGGSYRFETQVGNDFDDDIYEKIENLKRQGITAANAASFQENAKRGGKRYGKTKKTVFADKGTSPRGNARKNTAFGDTEGGSALSGKKKNANSSGNKAGKAVSSSVQRKENDRELQQQILLELKKRERRRKLVVLAASVVAVASFGYFGVYYYFAARTSMDYESLSALKNSSEYRVYQMNTPVQIHRTDDELPDILPEYQTLYQKNKKLIGWLKIDDTIIDYPVMQTGNNEYYLDHNFDQEYDKNGSIFLDSGCSIYPRSTNLIVYGHHMKSGKMFGQLQRYAKESYYKDHSSIQFDTIYERGTYEVMYVFRSQVYNEDDLVFKYYQFLNANSEAEFNSYMTEMEALSLYDTGVTASYGDSLLTLSTCDNSQTDGRFVVVARKRASND